MARTKPDIPTGSRIRVTYADGRPPEIYDASRAILLYDMIDLLGVTEADVPKSMFWMAWVAAGTPYLNGGGDVAAARAAARKWLADDVQTVEELEPAPAGPPTKSRAASRTSRA